MRIKSAFGFLVAIGVVLCLTLQWFRSDEPGVKTKAAVISHEKGTQERAPTTGVKRTVVGPVPSAERVPASAGVATDPIQGFAEWSSLYAKAGTAERVRMVEAGMELARARRPVFKQLIKDDPKAALENAVPMVVRQKLPPEMLALLEDRVNGVGVLRVLQGVPLPGEALPVGSLTFREVEMKEGRTYRAYVYGRREQVLTWTAGASLNGVAMEADFAVNEMPSRTLEVGEIPPADKPAVVDCPVSGKQVFEDAEAIAEVITAATPAVETATDVQYFCNTMHIDVLNQTMIMGEGVSGGTAGFTGILPAAPTPALGNVKVIVIPMTYADQNAVPSTEAALYTTLRDVADHYSKASYGRLSLAGVVTPPVKLKHNEAWYVNRDTSNGGDISGTAVEMQEARDEARKMGFDWNDYDCTVVRHNGGPGSYGGLGGGSTVWVRGDSTGLWAHEIGHCFGLGHANFWDTAGTSSIGNGINQEYGDSYDIMGNSGSFPSGHYNTQFKNAIRWLPSNYLLPVAQSGLYRIHAYDQGTLDPTRRYALNIVKDAPRVYWGEVHSLFDTNPWVKNGMVLGWRFPNGGGNFQLIDTTNGSPFGKEDAPISLGNTFSDTETGVHMTLVAANETPRYMDVQVNLGSYPTNQRPTMTLAASAAVVPLNATVTFTATASDPEGDTLAYAWQHFGNASTKIVSPNAAVITRQFTAAGSYVVACTVSDMKGGTVTRSQLITVGTSTTFTISGRVTLLGAGLQDVVITANGANGVVTDADGYFTVPNLSANNYTLTPLLYGYSFGELFNNSITVGPNFSGASFEATAQPVVTVTTPTPTANELAPVAAGSFRISRTGDTSQLLVVNVNTAQGSATKTTDYALSPDYATGSLGFSTFTIPEGADFLDVTVTPVTDSTVEGPETVTLQLGPGNGYLVTTPSTATVTIADDDTALPKVAITATANSTMEGLASPAVLTLSRTGSMVADLAVSYTVGGTASSGGDYTALSGTATIPAGSATAVVNVVPVNDAVSEQLKTVVLTLAANAAYLVDSTAATATINLYDDDTQVVTVAVTDASAREVNLTAPGALADTGSFVVTRSGDIAAPLTVYYAFAGTYGAGVMALHGVDYEALPGSVVIPAGQTQASITVVPRFDGIGEGPEQAVLYLGANATNYILGASNTAFVTIEDNVGDLQYIDVVNTASASEPSTVGTFRFGVRGSPASLPLRVNYTLSGTAVNGTDYDSGAGFWNPQVSGVTENLNGIWGSDVNNLWAVGDGGVIRKWNGTAWSAQASGVTTVLRAVWGTSATNVWAVGDGGVIRRWNGTAWSGQTSNTTSNLRGVWGSDTNNVWAVGDGGTIMKWNGTAWSAQASGITTALHGVWGSASTNVWAVGAGGVVRKWNGSAWSAQTSGTTETLRGVWGSNATNVWFAGGGGTVARFNGTVWTAQVSGTMAELSGIWGSDANNLWAPGPNGLLLRTTNGGSTWAVQISNTLQGLNSVRGTDGNNTWAVGAGGEMINRTTTGSIPVSGSLVIPVGSSTVDLSLRPVNDAVAEDVESITLTLTPDPLYQSFGPTSAATMWMRDDDTVNAVFVDTQVGTSGSWTVTEGTVSNPTKFYISRTGSTAADLTVNYILGGTATATDDYTGPTGSVVIPAGSLGVDIPVSIVNDALFEGVETITIDFAAGAYSRSAGTVMYIADNDAATGTVGFQQPGSSGSESVTSVSIPVTLSAAQPAPVTVQYAVSGTSTASSVTATAHTLPFWVRVVKTGNTITHFESNDGTIWTQRSSSFTVSGLGTTYLAGIAASSGTGTTTNAATVDGFSITGLSPGASVGAETGVNIGAVNGSHTVTSGTYNIAPSGAGITINTTTDGFRFIYVPVSNSADCTVTARLVSMSTTPLARTGVMLRSTTATGSIYAASLAGGSTTNLPFVAMNRMAANAAANSSSAITSMVLPYWHRIVRTGDSFATSFSKDGTTWSPLGTAQTLAVGPTVLAGLVVTASSDGLMATGTFDNVTLNGTPATGLLGRTVGFVNEQGSESLSGGVWTVNGSGAGITSSNDEAHFVAKPVSGDFTLAARVTSLAGGAAAAEAGVMVRHTRDGYSRSIHAGWLKSGSHAQRFRLQGFTNAFGTGIDFTLNPGTLTFLPGETLQNIVLNVTNDTVDEANNLVTIQLTNATGANVLSSGAYHGYTIVDDDDPPANPYAGFASSTSTVGESAGVVGLPVSLSAPATAAGSVSYSVTDGTASGADFTLASGTLTFTEGQSVLGLPLTVIDDTVQESPETVVVTLQTPLGLQLGSNTTHTVTIMDNDLPVVTLVANDPTASEAGPDNGQFTLSRTGETTQPLVVTVFRDSTSTTTDGFDCAVIPTTHTIPAGASSITLNVVPVDDALNEGTETVALYPIASSLYVQGTPAVATVSILDDDRSTVTLVANDNTAAEGGGAGQLTLTRTAPTNVALSVGLVIAGTATNGADYTTIATPVSIPIGQTTVTVNVTPIEDSVTEGDEQVTASLNTGSYDIGADAFGVVTIADNDSPPTLFINSPASQGLLIANGNGVILSATITDDGGPAPVTQTWTQISGPGVATIESPTAAVTAVTFSAPGTYILRITATDTQFTVSDQVTVVVGSALVAADWITQDLGPVSARRGQGVEFGGQFSVTGTGAGYGATADQAHVMVRQVSGDGSIVARLGSLPVAGALAGVTIRDSMTRGARRAVLGFVPGTGLQFRTRATTAGAADALTASQAGLSLPLWLKLERNAGTGAITASYAPDSGGAAGAWAQLGTSANVTMDAVAEFGLTTTSNNAAPTATAVFSSVGLTPAPSGPALLSEDATASPAAPGSGSESGGTTTIVGSTSGYYHGWQYYGDMVVTARLATFSSGAGSASGGLRVVESLENGGYLHLGRMPQGAYNGYYWVPLAGGSSNGVPSGIAAGNWIRLVRKGNSLTGYRAADVSGSPGTWIQIGQPQTIIMTVPVWVGFYVNNSSGVGMNTCTFSGLTIAPLNKAPVVGIASVATWPLSPVPLDGTVTDDSLPAPVSLTSLWSKRSGPGAVAFSSATLADTNATLAQAGDYVLRLTANDGGAQTFRDLSFTGYTRPFEVWQGQNWSGTGGVGDPNAFFTADADYDGQLNLLEYAFGTAPQTSNAGPVIQDTVTVGADKFLRLTVPKNPNATDVTHTVEATSTLDNPTNWRSAGLVIESNTGTQLIVRDNVPIAPGVRRFMRVRVERVP